MPRVWWSPVITDRMSQTQTTHDSIKSVFIGIESFHAITISHTHMNTHHTEMLCAPWFHINWVFFWCATIVLFKWIEARLWATVGDTKHVNWIYTITNIACTTDHKWYKCALSVSAMPYTKHWASMKRMKDWIWYVNGWRNLLSTLYSCMANAVVDIDVSCLQFFFYATFFFFVFSQPRKICIHTY